MFRFSTFISQVYLPACFTPLDAATDVSVEHWLEECTLETKKKELYANTYQQYGILLDKIDRLNAENLGSKGLPPKEIQGDSFIKKEFLPPEKMARTINSRNARTKVTMGPYIHAIEHAFWSLNIVGPFWDFLFRKGIRPDLLTRVMYDKFVKYESLFESDFSTFEGSISSALMKSCECLFYKYMLQFVHRGSEAANFITGVIAGTNYYRNKFGKFKCLGKRMSGDMCTSLGNTFTNSAVWAFIAYQLRVSIDGIFEGDDGILGGQLPLQEAISTFDKLGLSIKLDRKPPSETKFCNTYLDFNSLQVVRDPIKVLCVFSWTLSDFKHTSRNKVLEGLLRAKAISLACETPSCPLLWALAQRALELTSESNAIFSRDDRNWLVDTSFFKGVSEPANTTRCLFDRLFGIDISTQVLVEKQILASGMGWIESPSLDSIVPSIFRRMFDDYVILSDKVIYTE